MADELPPVVTELDAKIDKAIAHLAEMEAAMKAFGDRVGKQQKLSGEKAGKDAGEALMREYGKAIESGAKLPKFSKVLDTEIARSKNLVMDLAKELRKTGDIDVFQKLKAAEKDLASLEKLGKDAAQAAAGGFKQAEQSIASAVQGALKSGIQGAPVIAALVGLGVIASPLIGGVVAGGILSGIATAGIGAAVVGQLHDPQIATGFANLKSTAMSVLTAATAPMQPVIAQALSQATGLLQQSEEPLQKVFTALAPAAQTFFGAIEAFVQNAAPGFLEALTAGGDVLQQISPAIADLGNSVKKFFDEVSNGSQGGADALSFFIRIVGAAIEATGYLVHGLSQFYEEIVGIADVMSGKYSEGWMRITGAEQNAYGPTAKLGKAFEDAAAAANAEGDAMDKLTKQMEDSVNANLAASDATIAQKQSVEDLSVAIAENGRNWDINTDAGRKNTLALNEAIHRAEAKREADIKNGDDAMAAAETFEQETGALIKMAQQFGLTADAAKNLAGTYIVDIDVIYREVKSHLTAAQFAANPSGLAGGGFYGPYGQVTHAASGLLTASAPGTILAAEPQTGGEYLIPRRGISQTRAADLISSAAADHGLSMQGDGAYLSLRIPVSIDGRQFVEATYEGFVNFSQERKDWRGSTGLQ